MVEEGSNLRWSSPELFPDQLHNFKQLCFLAWSKSLSVEISLLRAAGGLTFQQYLQCRPATFRHSHQQDNRGNGILARAAAVRPPQDGIAHDEASVHWVPALVRPGY